MVVEQDDTHRVRNQESMAQDLSSWFCELSTQERLQASAVLRFSWELGEAIYDLPFQPQVFTRFRRCWVPPANEGRFA